jgi:hypothetical protein
VPPRFASARKSRWGSIVPRGVVCQSKSRTWQAIAGALPVCRCPPTPLRVEGEKPVLLVAAGATTPKKPLGVSAAVGAGCHRKALTCLDRCAHHRWVHRGGNETAWWKDAASIRPRLPGRRKPHGSGADRARADGATSRGRSNRLGLGFESLRARQPTPRHDMAAPRHPSRAVVL